MTIKRAVLVDDAQKSTSIRHGALDLEPVANDSWIGEQSLDASRREARHALRLEVRKRLTIGVALVEDRRPAQAGLSALEREQLEQCTIVMLGNAPFAVVIHDIHRGARPGTSIHAVSTRRR